ncbi:SDR family oxidoreductase [Agrobacterium tumefaciens]|uniref:SDR family oxidoreductase n=1 Tax=Agrobacterium tumefaciens TaxID=358 RepID=UPI003AF9E896
MATSAFWQNNPPDAKRTQKITSTIAVGRMGTPDDAANAVSFFCGDRASFVTGQAFYICGGVTVGIGRKELSADRVSDAVSREKTSIGQRVTACSIRDSLPRLHACFSLIASGDPGVVPPIKQRGRRGRYARDIENCLHQGPLAF